MVVLIPLLQNTIKFFEDDEVIMRAKLADDRKSFKVKSIAGDIFGILKNIKFTRQS